jgi:2-polyprenyl-3-methyl-5-hydroxy-6-metoxy-1,4-benzoquinol methylase
MNYRERLYNYYVSTHTSYLYGEASLDRIKRQFPIWEWYFGRFLPKGKDTKILDAGCGNGGFVYFLRSIGYKNSQGIDISKEQVEDAKRLGIQNIEMYDLSEFLKIKQNFYDTIFARDIVEHFEKEEIMDVLSLIFNSLKLGGTVVIQAPNAQNLFSSRLRYGDFTHEIAFTKDSLNQILRATGFNEVAFYPTGPVPKGIKSVIRFFLWKIIETFLRFYMLVETGTGKGIFTQNIICFAKK